MIEFSNADLSIPHIPTEQVKEWLINVAIKFDRTIGSLNYIFCSDEYLLDINQRFLGHDYYTDIITFPMNTDGPLEAEIYISLDRVKENAQQENLLFATELYRVMVHGFLHLIGFNDGNEEEKLVMRAEEDLCLNMVSF